MLKKRLLLIIIAVAAVGALIAAYFIFSPMWVHVRPPLELDPGEIEQNGRLLMRPQIEQKDMSRVEIHNKLDDYALVNNGSGQLILEGYPQFDLDPYARAYIAVDSGYLKVNAKVIVDPPDLSVYGLDRKSDPVTVTVTTLKKEKYTVIFGDKIPTSAGYYAMLEGRNTVYVLDTTIEGGILLSSNDLITPYLWDPSHAIQQNETYLITDFSLYKEGALVFTAKNRALGADGKPAAGAVEDVYGSINLLDYIMTKPTAYIPDVGVLTNIFGVFLNLTGTKVMAYGEFITDELLEEYGFDGDDPQNLISFMYKGIKYNYLLVLPEPDSDYYCVWTNQAPGIIAAVPRSAFAFMDYDFIKFIDRPLIGNYINDLAQIRVFTPEGSQYGPLDETFDLTGTGQDLVVTRNNSKILTTDTFRQYYKALLSIEMVDYEAMPEGEPAADIIITVTDRSGVTTEYAFYFVSTRREFYTVNGVGEFYVIRDWVPKLISDTKKAAADIMVDSDAPY